MKQHPSAKRIGHKAGASLGARVAACALVGGSLLAGCSSEKTSMVSPEEVKLVAEQRVAEIIGEISPHWEITSLSCDRKVSEPDIDYSFRCLAFARIRMDPYPSLDCTVKYAVAARKDTGEVLLVEFMYAVDPSCADLGWPSWWGYR